MISVFLFYLILAKANWSGKMGISLSVPCFMSEKKKTLPCTFRTQPVPSFCSGPLYFHFMGAAEDQRAPLSSRPAAGCQHQQELTSFPDVAALPRTYWILCPKSDSKKPGNLVFPHSARLRILSGRTYDKISALFFHFLQPDLVFFFFFDKCYVLIIWRDCLYTASRTK